MTLLKAYLKKLSLPLTALAIVLSLTLIWRLFDLPPEEELIVLAKQYFAEYGLITVFIASLIEGMLLVGWYIPGGLVIFLGVILAAGNPERAVFSVLATIAGLFLAYLASYALGRFGWYKLFMALGLKGPLEDAKEKFQKKSFKAIYATFWQPNLAGLISTSAGILHASFKKFFITALIATIFWSAFWGSAAYLFGEKILDYLGGVFFVTMAGWIVIEIVKYRRSIKSAGVVPTN